MLSTISENPKKSGAAVGTIAGVAYATTVSCMSGGTLTPLAVGTAATVGGAVGSGVGWVCEKASNWFKRD
jgi:hypothetical protein